MNGACVLPVMAALAAFTASAGPGPDDRYTSGRCRPRSGSRIFSNQGTLLWGTRHTWAEEAPADARTSVLVAARHGGGKGALKLREGTVLQGEGSDGKPVEVVVCGAEPAPEDPEMVWHRIEAWNPIAKEWENPCIATGAVPSPRALVFAGTWNATGAHRADPGKVTFACEAGALAKCAAWGYRPWASVGGRSLADAHQACTRMVRADYCGNGRSHTKPGTLIDYYDSIGVASRTTRATPAWDPAQASFEAAWAPDGATCLSRMREGEALDEIRKECPGRFKDAAGDLGDGDLCAVQQSRPVAPLLRNRSIPRQASPSAIPD